MYEIFFRSERDEVDDTLYLTSPTNIWASATAGSGVTVAWDGVSNASYFAIIEDNKGDTYSSDAPDWYVDRSEKTFDQTTSTKTYYICSMPTLGSQYLFYQNSTRYYFYNSDNVNLTSGYVHYWNFYNPSSFAKIIVCGAPQPSYTRISANAFNISWPIVTSADKYRYRVGTSGAWSAEQTTTTCSVYFNGGTTHTVQVQAYNAETDLWGNIGSVSIECPKLSAPTSLSFTQDSAIPANGTASFTLPDYADEYTIEVLDTEGNAIYTKTSKI